MDTHEEAKLKATIAQLKTDLGHRRSDGYTVAVFREEIDRLMAEHEEGPEMAVLRYLRGVAHRDHSSGMFEKPPKP